MSSRKPKSAEPTSEDLGLRLLESVRQMKAGRIARVTHVELNEVVQARQSTVSSTHIFDFCFAFDLGKTNLCNED